MNADNPNASDETMLVLMEHYLKHHEIVLKKLGHAQTATKMSVDEADISNMWNEIIAIFKDFGASEDDLFAIEGLLNEVPETIKAPYLDLMRQDESLQTLIADLKSDEYQNAKTQSQAVQSKPNPMSGLTSDDYEESTEDSEVVKAFKFTPKTKASKKS